MIASIDRLNQMGQAWWTWTWHAGWQSALAAFCILAILRLGRRWNAPLRHGLLLVALVKFALPPLLMPAPVGIFSWARAESKPAASFGPVIAIKRETQSPQITGPSQGGSNPLMASGFSSSWSALPTSSSQPEGRRSPLDWRAVLMLVHALGSAAVLAWFVWQWARLASLRRRAQTCSDPALVQALDEITEQLRFLHKPALLVSTHCLSPAAFGVLRPVITIPERLLSRFSQKEWRPVLAHELVHIQRGDLWGNALQLALLACWWFNPMIWILNRAIRKAREDCCDDALLARGLASRETYCEVLVRAAHEVAVREANCATLGLGDDLHPLGRRLRRIMDQSLGRSAKLSLAGTGLVLAVAALVLPGLRSEETLQRKPAAAPASAPQQASAATNALVDLEELFASLRWVSQDNLFFEETRQKVQQMDAKGVPFLLGKLASSSPPLDEAQAADARRTATMALGLLGRDHGQVIPKLEEELEDEADLTYSREHPAWRVHLIRNCCVAADALGQIGPAASNAIPALIDSAGFGNGYALVALARIAPGSPKTLHTLTNALNDFTKGDHSGIEGDFRFSAVKALQIAAKKNPEALAALASALDDGDPRFRSAVAAGLASLRTELAAATPIVTTFIERGTLRQRTFMAAALANVGVLNDNILSCLLAGLHANDPEFTQSAIEGLAAFGSKAADAVPSLSNLAVSQQGEIRAAALRALRQIASESPETSKAVLENVTHPDESVRMEAIYALGQMPAAARQAAPQLIGLIQHGDTRSRQSAMGALAEAHAAPAETIPILKAALDDPDPQIASSALVALGKYPEATPELLPRIIEAMAGTNAWAAAITLGDFGPSATAAVPALTRALTNSQQGVRGNSALALGKIGSAAQSAVPALEKSLLDPASIVRQNAAMALWKIAGRTNVIGKLIERLQTEEGLDRFERLNLKSTRLWDIRQLGEVGPAAKAALPVLRRYADEPDPGLSKAAQEAMQRIQAKL